mmetsp:Transcript_21371/g.40165  ORF Transcript_21371/g.40165 Transcript_21371/m.40165 type:complete len:684 (+) Transcript_21371:212-2263(+)
MPNNLFMFILLLSVAAARENSKAEVIYETSSSLSIADVREQIIKDVLGGELDPEHKHQVRVLISPGQHKTSLQLDHPALSYTSWEGVPITEVDGSTSLPIISGGIEVPFNRFTSWDSSGSILKASLKNLGATDLGKMTSGNAVADCQHDKVGLTINGEQLVLARWPNINISDSTTADGWIWTHANVDDDIPIHAGFKSMNDVSDPDAARLLNWANESNPYVHIYGEWDWADAYASITSIVEGKDGFVSIEYDNTDGAPLTKPYARWMGVNLLCELDSPGEYYIDEDEQALYVFPPSPLKRTDSVMLGYQPGAVVNITSAVSNVTLKQVDVRDGRHEGVHVEGAIGVRVENVISHGHGTNGIVLEGAIGATVKGNSVYDVGCSGIRASAGVAMTLEKGKMRIEFNDVHHHARWKRSYQPGIFWSGVNNSFVGNTISVAPHNCMLGGGDFGDGVENVFESNSLADCTFETTDSGGFYTCGQGGFAFVNRGNVLRNNTFLRVRNTAGMGVQIASSQAVYLDDQMSDWLITDNTFVDCEVGTFTGGGRRNIIANNTYINVGTVHYLNNQGMNWDKDTVCDGCSEIKPPGYSEGETVCSTGAATWMASFGPAAEGWASKWPEMLTIGDDYCGEPAYSSLTDNVYCGSLAGEAYFLGCPQGTDADCSDAADEEGWMFHIGGNTFLGDCE